jgi:hypothetical protein
MLDRIRTIIVYERHVRDPFTLIYDPVPVRSFRTIPSRERTMNLRTTEACP